MKAVIIAGIVALCMATTAVAGVHLKTDEPVFRIMVDRNMGGTYQIYKYEEATTDCFIVVSTDYDVQQAISCVNKTK